MALAPVCRVRAARGVRAGEGVDLIRESVRMVMQELIEAEATEKIGAARYERTENRVNERNGARPRLLATRAGDVELRTPKLRNGSFFPVILEPRGASTRPCTRSSWRPTSTDSRPARSTTWSPPWESTRG